MGNFKKITRQDIIDVVDNCIRQILLPSDSYIVDHGEVKYTFQRESKLGVIDIDATFKNTSEHIFATMQVLMDNAGRHDDAALMASFLVAAKLLLSNELKAFGVNPTIILCKTLNQQLNIGCAEFDIDEMRASFYDLIVQNEVDLDAMSSYVKSLDNLVKTKNQEAREILAANELEPEVLAVDDVSTADEFSGDVILNTTLADIAPYQLDGLFKKHLEQLVKGSNTHAYLNPSTRLSSKRSPNEGKAVLTPSAPPSTPALGVPAFPSPPPSPSGQVTERRFFSLPPIRPDEQINKPGPQTWGALVQETTRNIYAHMGVMIKKAKARLPEAKAERKLTENELLLGAYMIAMKVQLGAEGELEDISINDDLQDFLYTNGLQDVTLRQINGIESRFLALIEYDVSYGQKQTSFAAHDDKVEEPTVSQDPLLEAAKIGRESTLLEDYAEETEAYIEEASAQPKILEMKNRLQLIGNACEQYLSSIEKAYKLSIVKNNDPALKVKYEYFVDILNIVRDPANNEVQKMGKLEAKFSSRQHTVVMESLSKERGNPIVSALRDIVSWFTSFFRKAKLGETFVDKLNTLKNVDKSGTDAKVLADSAKALVVTSPKLKPRR